MKFKRFNNFKKIIKRHYEIQMNYYIDEINTLKQYSDTLNNDIITLLQIIDHYEEILKESGIEFESFSYIFRKPEEL